MINKSLHGHDNLNSSSNIALTRQRCLHSCSSTRSWALSGRPQTRVRPTRSKSFSGKSWTYRAGRKWPAVVFCLNVILMITEHFKFLHVPKGPIISRFMVAKKNRKWSSPVGPLQVPGQQCELSHRPGETREERGAACKMPHQTYLGRKCYMLKPQYHRAKF